jgi:hypothetical protein
LLFQTLSSSTHVSFFAEPLHRSALAHNFAFFAAFKMGVNVRSLQSPPRSLHDIFVPTPADNLFPPRCHRSRACSKILCFYRDVIVPAPAARYFVSTAMPSFPRLRQDSLKW